MARKFGISGQNKDPLAYQDSRLAGVPTVDFSTAPTVLDWNYPIQTIGRDRSTGDEYILVGFNGGDADWRLFSSGTGDLTKLGVDTATAPGVNPVLPTPPGVITVKGAAVPAHNVPVETHSRAINEFNVEAQYAETKDVATATSSGLIHGDESQFTIDSVGFLQQKFPVPKVPGAYNLGLFYSSPTATIKGADGNDLSATNPGYLVLPSNTNLGALVTHKITSNYTFDDAGGASVFAGSLFGFDAGDTIATSQAGVPFYLYAAAQKAAVIDSNPIFFISRVPNWPVLTASNLFNGTGGGADLMPDIMALENTTIADYNAASCVMVGSFVADIDGADDWVITSVNNTFNFNRYNQFNTTLLEYGVYGAAATSFFLDNGGTAPTVTNSASYAYKIDIGSNVVHVDMRLTLGGAPATAVDALMNLPLYGQSRLQLVGEGSFYDGGTGGNVYPIIFRQRTGTTAQQRQCQLFKGNTTTGKWQYDEFAVGDIILAQFSYRLN